MLSIVDPPAPALSELMFIFSIDSATSSKLYPHGGDVKDPFYVIVSEGDASHVVLRTGAGQDIGRIDQPGFLGRLRKQPWTVKLARAQAPVPFNQWLEFPVDKADGREDRAVRLKIDGKEYAWTAHVQDGGRGIYTVNTTILASPTSWYSLYGSWLAGMR
jgi:hypothetical protein